MESLVAYLGGRAPVETYKLFPSDESTQFGDWVKAGALKAGDQLSVRLGIDAVAGDQTVTVKSTTQTHTPHRVYNLEINSQNNQITHNYFVGEDELWVHNIKAWQVAKKLRNRGYKPIPGDQKKTPCGCRKNYIKNGIQVSIDCIEKGYENFPHIDVKRGKGKPKLRLPWGSLK